MIEKGLISVSSFLPEDMEPVYAALEAAGAREVLRPRDTVEEIARWLVSRVAIDDASVLRQLPEVIDGFLVRQSRKAQVREQIAVEFERLAPSTALALKVLTSIRRD